MRSLCFLFVAVTLSACTYVESDGFGSDSDAELNDTSIVVAVDRPNAQLEFSANAELEFDDGLDAVSVRRIRVRDADDWMAEFGGRTVSVETDDEWWFEEWKATIVSTDVTNGVFTELCGRRVDVEVELVWADGSATVSDDAVVVCQ